MKGMSCDGLHEITVYTVGYERAGRVENGDILVKIKSFALFVIFFFFIIASCSIGLVRLIRIALLWEDLSARVFHRVVKVSSSGSEFSTDGYKSVGLEEGIPRGLQFS